MTAETCTRHSGHRRWFGGCLDGQIDHLSHAAPSDFPHTFGSVLREGQRSWYVLDETCSAGTEAVYRLLGHGATIDDATRRQP